MPYNVNPYYLFTLHFATINTTVRTAWTNLSWLFTLHFATINTVDITSSNTLIIEFTLHFATINTYMWFYRRIWRRMIYITLCYY